MGTRVVVTSLIVVGLLASPALAADAPHGRGPVAQAAMIAETAGRPKQPVQVLNQLCDNPITQHGCEPLKANMRRALERAIDAPITWVAHRRRHAGQFWVLGTVRFNGSEAHTGVSWRDPGAYRCFGWTKLSWRRNRGTWSMYQGVSAEGCTAAA